MWGARSVWLGCSRAVGWGDALSPVLNATINICVSASYNPIWSQVRLMALVLPWGCSGISTLFPYATPHLSGYGDRLVFSSKESVVSPSCSEPFSLPPPSSGLELPDSWHGDGPV